MGMLSAMYSGVSGLAVHGKALSTVADNIANVNTVGFKYSRANFGDIMVESLTVGGAVVSQVGTGARVLNVQSILTQGSFESTDVPTDMAINGRGFFQVVRPSTGETSYTRAGQFMLDQEGYMVSALGDRLQGYNVDANGDILQIPEDLRILIQQTDAVATQLVEMSVNLDAEDLNETHPSQAIVPTDQSTWNYLTPTRVYDSLGVAHDIAVMFQRLSTYEGSAMPPDSSTVWKASVFENEDGTFTTTNIGGTNTFYMHFDDYGHLVGTSVGQPGYGDVFQTQSTFGTGLATTISDRLGEILSYDNAPGVAGGTQTYISTVTLQVNTANAGDLINIGGTDYAADDAATLVDAINADTTNGFWATLSAGDVVLYSDGSSPLDVVIPTAVDWTMVGNTFADLQDAINNGRAANLAVQFSNTPEAGDILRFDFGAGNVDVTFAGTETTAALVAAAINGAAGIAGNVTATAIAGTNTIMIEADAVGSAQNAWTCTFVDTGVDDDLLVSNTTLAGGMDPTATTNVEAGLDLLGNNHFQIGRSDTGSAAELSVDVGTLGATVSGVDLTMEQFTYASDAQTPENWVSPDDNSLSTITFNWLAATGANQPQDIAFDFTPTDSAPSTQSAGASETFYLYQDGSTRGSLQTLDIDRNGIISGQFSNGILRVLGQVVLADFANPAALERSGDNLWSQTINSGEPVINVPGQGGRGQVESGALEQSNVDMAQEFVKMINFQRAFQANSRIISTTDSMLAELINLKR